MRERGFTYFAVLFLIAVTALASSGAAMLWHTVQQREKERELLAVGAEFRRAIARYLAATPSGRPQYPRSLEDLTRDPRVPGVARHLRRVYVDPITGNAEWGIVRAPDGGVLGVYSLSAARPLKLSGFAPTDQAFEGAERYSDWKFVHRDRNAGAPGPGRRPSSDGRFERQVRQ
jgi:type II secretory pathway pseudopilin PulG